MVPAMRPGLAKIIEKVRNRRHFEWPETDLHVAENACCIDYFDTQSVQQVHWVSKSQSTNRSTTYHGCENTGESDTADAWESQPITRIHPQVAQRSKIPWSPTTLQNTGWMDYHHVRQQRFNAIPILYLVDVEQAYGDSASRYHCQQWHVRSYGRRCTSLV